MADRSTFSDRLRAQLMGAAHREQHSGQQVTIHGPDGRTFDVALPRQHVFPRAVVWLVVIMSAVMVVPITHWAFGLWRAVTLYVWAMWMIRGAFARGRLSVFDEQQRVAETIREHYTLQPDEGGST